MALQVNYYYPEFDITIYNAYWRINPNRGINGGKDEIRYTIEIFKNAEIAHQKDSRPFKAITRIFIPDMSQNAVNFISQAYNHAKSLPEFSGCVDV